MQHHFDFWDLIQKILIYCLEQGHIKITFTGPEEDGY